MIHNRLYLSAEFSIWEHLEYWDFLIDYSLKDLYLIFWCKNDSIFYVIFTAELGTCTGTFHPPPLHSPLPLLLWLDGEYWLLFQAYVFLSGTPLLGPGDLEQLVCVPAVLYFWRLKIDFPAFSRCSLQVSLSPHDLCRLCHQQRERGPRGTFGALSTQHRRAPGRLAAMRVH